MIWRRGGKPSPLLYMTNEKDNVPLTLFQLNVIVEGLNCYYVKLINRTTRHEERTGEPRTRKTTEMLAEVQETLQYMALQRNIRDRSLNPDVARSGGIELGEDEKASDSAGESVGT